ncbi:MAG: hypothetical protein E7Z80_01705 [Methanobrevibacter thaueri]|nr:hypothetical protein [Methanobrevibacter thaueri]
MKKINILILLLIMVVILATSAVSAAEANVTSESFAQATDDVNLTSTDNTDALTTGGGNFADLQTAINNPQAGKVILTSNYTRVGSEGAVLIEDDIEIDGKGFTIDGNNAGGIFNIKEGVIVALQNITLINGKNTNGGAIYNNGILTITNSKFINNTATNFGGAIYNNNTYLSITGSTFDNNNITNRSSGNGGAAIYSEQGTVLISHCNVTNNVKTIKHRGGTKTAYKGDLINAAVTSDNGVLTVTDSYFANNKGAYGGAILSAGDNGVLKVSGSVFENNFAFNGGAIDFTGKNYTITTSNFTGNMARGTGSSASNVANGGAICAQESNSESTISECIFKDNSASIGGAISGSTTQVTICTFINNTAKEEYSESYNGNNNTRGGSGGAIQSDSIDITGSVFVNNTSRLNPIYMTGEGTISDSSFTNTTIYTRDGPLTVSNNHYDNDGADVSGFDIHISGDGEIPKTSGGPVYYDVTSFTSLQNIIDTATGTIYLTNDITKQASEYDTFANGIQINKKVSINTGGYTITSNNGPVFTVDEDCTLTFSGNIVGDGNQYPIINKGTVTNIAHNFTELNNLISLVDGGVLNIGNAKVTKSESEKTAFTEGIIINKNITLKGNKNNYIDASNSGRIFKLIDGASLTLDTNNLKNSNANYGAAVYVSAGTTFNAKNVIFNNNTAKYRGGAIYSEGTVDVDGCTFDSNDITYRAKNKDHGGAAIYNNDGTLYVNNSLFKDNLKNLVLRNPDTKGDLIDGIVFTSGTATIENSNFYNNSGCYGGAITALPLTSTSNPSLTVDNCNFTDNVAYDGGAMYIGWGAVDYTVSNSQFINNLATGIGSTGYTAAGGAIVIPWNPTPGVIVNCTFKNNNAKDGASPGGSAISIEDASLNIEGCLFENNYASASGGAVEISRSGTTRSNVPTNIVIENSNFTSNTAGELGGAIVAVEGSSLDLTGCQFENNAAAYGNAVYNEGNLTLSKNKVISDKAEIISNGEVASKINIVILEGGSVAGKYNVPVTVTANVTDDNGNIIDCDNVYFLFDGENPTMAIYNAQNKLYEAQYTPTHPGIIIVSVNETEIDADVTTGQIVIEEKFNATLIILGDKIVKGEDAVIDILLLGINNTDLNATVKINVNNKIYNVDVVNGIGNLTIKNLPVNVYPIFAIFDTHPYYNTAYDSDILYVKETTILTVDPVPDAKYDEIINVTIHLTDSDGTGLTGTVDVEGISVHVVDGVGILTIDNQPDVDNYTLNVVYAGDSIYNQSSANFSFKVITNVLDPQDIDYSFNGNYDEGLNITIKSPADETYIVNINGTDYAVDVFNGVGSKVVNLPRGNYDAVITINNTNYELTPIEYNFDYKSTPVYNVVIEGNYREVIVVITGTPGNYTVYVDDEHEITISFNGTEGTGVITGLDAGEYTAMVSYDNNDEYYGDTKDVNFTVDKLNAALYIYPHDITYGENAMVYFQVYDVVDPTFPVSGKVKFIIQGYSEDEVDIVNRKGNITIPDLNPGVYYIMAIFESNNYNVDYDSDILTVRDKTILTVDPVPDAKYNEVIDVTIHLTDSEGKGLTGIVYVEGIEVLVVDGVGILTIDNQPDVGNYTMNVVYDGEGIYNQSSAKFSFKVITNVINASDIDFSFNGNYDEGLNITIKSPVDDTYIVDIEGNKYAIDVVDGVGSKIVNLPCGNYDAVITINNTNYELTPIEYNFDYKSSPIYSVVISGTYPEAVVTITGTPGNYTIYVDDEHEITISFNGTEGTGVITGLDAGEYTAMVSYDNNDKYYGDTKDVNFTVAKAQAALYVNVDNIIRGENATIFCEVIDSRNDINVSGKVKLIISGVGEKEVTIVNGKGNINISDLNVGVYNILAVFESNNYELAYNSEILYVKIATVLTPFVEENYDYGDVKLNFTLTAEGDDMDAIIYVTVNDTVYPVFIHDSVGTLSLNDLAPGYYSVSTVYGGSESFNESETDDVYFTILSQTAQITIDVNNTVYGNDNTVIVTIENATGNITYNVNNGESKTAELVNGVATITIKANEMIFGKNIINVAYPGDEYFKPLKANATFNATKNITEFTITTGEAIVGQSVTVTILLPGVTDEIQILIDGNEDNVNVTDGIGTYVIPADNVTKGIHFIAAVFKGNAYFEPVIGNINFTAGGVENYTFDVNITIDEINLGEELSFNVTLPMDANGNVVVKIDDVTVVESPVINGTASVVVPADKFSAGKHNISVSYGDDIYAQKTVVKAITVAKAPSELYASADNVTVGQEVNVTVTVPTYTNGRVYVVLNDVVYNVTINNGKGSAVIKNLAANTYIASVYFTDDSEYLDNTTKVIFTVSKVVYPASEVINITIPVITITLPADATGNLTVNLNGTVSSAVLVNGSARVVLPSNLTAGNYTAVITYSGDDKFDVITTTAKVTVEDNVPESAFTIPTNSTSDTPTFSINLENATGTFEVDIDGTKYTQPLVNGSASITVDPLSEGSHNVTVIYSGDANYGYVIKTTSINISAPVYKITNNKDVSVLYTGSASYQVILTKNGQPVGAAEIVTIVFNGVTYHIKTNDDGLATFNINTNIKIGRYTLVASYNGDTVTNFVSINNIVKAPSKKVKKSKKTTKVKISLLNVNGKVQRGKIIVVKFNKKSYKIKTNSKGVATWKVKKSMVKKLKKGKKYTYTATYDKDSASNKLKIK